MIKQLLPEIIIKCLERFNYNEISEIRIRRNSPVIINYRGTNKVLVNNFNEKVFATSGIIEFVLKRATEYSLYAFNNQIKQGFITAKGGFRIGIAGESVNSDNFMPTTMKNINSLNIRIPHEVEGCSNNVFKSIYDKDCGIKSTLIISPPGAGKTTLIRDISRQLSNQEKVFNVFVVDERFEIASVVNGEAMLNVGCFSDIVSGANKNFAFNNGIRALKPDVIITDELISIEDVDACKNAINSGVKVLATVHAENHRDLMNKNVFKGLFEGKVFERYVIMNQRNGPGGITQILDESFKPIYF